MTRARGVALAAVLYLGVLAAAPSGAALLENPGHGGCSRALASYLAGRVKQMGPSPSASMVPLVYGSQRPDVLEAGACTHDRAGFVAIWNWARLGDGEHTAVADDTGVAFERATCTVGSTGEEFLQGAMRRQVLEHFPAPGEPTILEWNESTQPFEIRGVLESPMGGGYDLSYWQQLSRDLFQGAYRTAEFLYAEEPALDTCGAGELTQAAKSRALEAMNQIRALHHLSPVQYRRRDAEQMQPAALSHALPGGRGHFPPPRAQGSTEEGASGSGSRHLWRLPRTADPAAHRIGWTKDAETSAGGAAGGQRRGLRTPFAPSMSSGQGAGAAGLKVHRFHAEPPLTPQGAGEEVAVPSETSPFPLVEGTPGSFRVLEEKRRRGGNHHPSFEAAPIRVVRTSDNASLVITARYTDREGFGVPHRLSWQVEGGAYDTLYEVELRNVSMQSGETRSYSYPVFIERASIEY